MNILIALLLVAQQGIDAKIDEFARALKPGELENRLRDALLTPAGKTVVKEEFVAAMARKIAAEYFVENFDEQGRVRESARAEIDELLKEFEVYQSDIKELKAAADAVADKIADEPEIGAQVKKLLRSDAGQQLLYLLDLRRATGHAQPAVDRIIKKQIDRAFVADAEGKLVLREEAKEKIEPILALADEKLKAVEELSKKLKEIAAKLSDEGINGRIRKALESPLAAAVILAHDQEPRVEEAFIEVEGKLTLKPDMEETAERLLKVWEEGGRRLESYRATFDQLVERIKDDGAMGTRVRTALKNDLVRAALVAKLPGPPSAKSVTEAFQKWFATVFEEREGVYRLKEGLAEKAAANLKKALHGARILKRAVELISQQARTVSDAEPVKAVYSTPLAAAKLVEGMIGHPEAMKHLGKKGVEKLLGEWFVKEGEQFSIREDARPKVEELLQKMEQAGKEK